MIIPSNPSVGDTLTVEEVEYEFNGKGWEVKDEVIVDKTTVSSDDIVIIQDSEDSNVYKTLEVRTLLDNEIKEW